MLLSGGQGWQGPTQCATGTCQVVSELNYGCVVASELIFATLADQPMVFTMCSLMEFRTRKQRSAWRSLQTTCNVFSVIYSLLCPMPFSVWSQCPLESVPLFEAIITISDNYKSRSRLCLWVPILMNRSGYHHPT